MRYAALLLFLISCAAVDQPQPDTEPTISLSATSAAPGQTVRITADGLPANTEVVVGAGPPASEYDVVQRVRTDAAGHVEASVTMPEYASQHQAMVFVVATPDNRTKVVSGRVQVTDNSGALTITGTVTDEGVECPAVRTADNQLYTIAGGDRSRLKPGVRVRITGTIAQMSFCMQGTTISASKIEVLQ